MHIILFGATGRTGNRLLNHLLDGGHTITALVRDGTSRLQPQEQLTVIDGDVTNPKDVESAFQQPADIVISALSTDKSDTLSTAFPHIIMEMEKRGIHRILTIGTAGILNARSEPDTFRFESKESRRSSTRAAEEHAAVYRLLLDSSLTWTIFCPTYLPDGEAVDSVAFEFDYLPEEGSRITTGSTAAFIAGHLHDESFHHARVGLVEIE
ncbi:NAD(P)-dependent oxidoreductase [Alkalicoccus urumqiensis]|uniref:NAD(P)-binding domain-containing protein n=1 Tax=Alkalicoccus urumqiensis TaxID=1548213 RepID=A0A2P6MEE7_ALKUR|nr:NAD(P)H-binding protein [Alkalicoccus urumqiensis]PRO64662.1 hypothetical protein C6I21_13220 [Alkalicoccus urumqiensis]